MENLDPAILKILRESRIIAVVGLSPKPDRPSHRVAAYLQRQGYRIVPVNPGVEEVLGERAYPNLRDVPFPVDCVDVFRKPEAVPPVAQDAIAVGAKSLWLQEGISHPEAERLCREAGLTVISDRCLLKEHMRLAKGAP